MAQTFWPVDYVQVPAGAGGLANSGTTDDTGTWATVDVNALSAVPSGATGALILVHNAGGANRWLGVRETGRTAGNVLADVTQQRYLFAWVKVLGGEVDFYSEEASTAKVWIVGYVNATWFNPDSPTLLDAPAGANQDVDISAIVPADCIGLLMNMFSGQNLELGLPSNAAADFTVRTYGAVVLDVESEVVRYDLAADGAIAGYITDGYDTAFPGEAVSLTHDSTWRDGDITADTYVAVAVRWVVTSNSVFSLRANGSTFNDIPTSSEYNGTAAMGHVGVDGDGILEYQSETGSTTTALVMGRWSAGAAGSSIAAIAGHHRRMHRG